MTEPDRWSAQISAMGAFIRRQRMLANLSLRDLAELTSVSNAYLSQIERGLHEPSVRVLTAVATALNVSAESLLTQAGLLDSREQAHRIGSRTEEAISNDPDLSDQHKQALLSMYNSYLAEGPKPTEP